MLEGLTPPLEDSLCKIGRDASELSAEDFAVLQSSLDNSLWTTAALAKALCARGFIVRETALRRHRKRECTCARAA